MSLRLSVFLVAWLIDVAVISTLTFTVISAVFTAGTSTSRTVGRLLAIQRFNFAHAFFKRSFNRSDALCQVWILEANIGLLGWKEHRGAAKSKPEVV